MNTTIAIDGLIADLARLCYSDIVNGKTTIFAEQSLMHKEGTSCASASLFSCIPISDQGLGLKL